MKSERARKLSAIQDLLKASWEAVQEDRVRFLLFIGFFVVSFSLELISPWAIGYVIGIFVEKGPSPETYQLALWGILAYVGLKLSSLFIHHVARYFQIRVAFTARMRVLNKFFGAYLKYPLSWHIKHHSGDNLSKLHRATGAVEQCVGNYLWQILEGFMKFAFAGVALLALDVWVALNVLSISLITVVVVVLYNKKLVQLMRLNNEFSDYLNKLCVDYFFNVITVKTLGLQKRAQDHVASQRDDGLRRVKAMAITGEIRWGMIGIGYSLLIGSSLLIYFRDVSYATKAFNVAEVYVLLNYLDRVFQTVGSFTGYYSGIIESATNYESAAGIIQGADDLGPATSVEPLPKKWKEVRAKDLVFAYDAAEQRGVRGISCKFQHGEKIALIGASGGGKSTLLKVFAGILHPQSGKVFVDETEVPIERLSRSTLMIPQEPEIFAGSLLFNLTMGEVFSEKEISDVLSLCRLTEVIQKLPEGLSTDLAEKGINISVGEKQRVAFARGLLRASHKDILLLDEPTSSLDPATERALFEQMLSTFSDRTILTACHRLSLAPLFDRVILIRRGKVVAQGSFEDLLAQDEELAASWLDFQKKTRDRESPPRPAAVV